jgi:hypothetical protein
VKWREAIPWVVFAAAVLLGLVLFSAEIRMLFGAHLERTPPAGPMGDFPPHRTRQLR